MSTKSDQLHSGTFDFQLHFSPAPTVSYRTLRDSFFSVTNGTVKKAKRLVAGQNTGWEIHVAPSGYGAVNLSASATSDCAASGAVCTDAGGKVSNSVNVTVPGPVRASVADASVTEGAGAGLDFAVTLSRSDTEQVTLRYATSDSAAARAGEDYEATSGTLTFAPGETAAHSTNVLIQSHILAGVKGSDCFRYLIDGKTLSAFGTRIGAGDLRAPPSR